MQERICPNCHRSNWSVNTNLGDIWHCWNCGVPIGPEYVVEEIPEVDPNSDSLDDLWTWDEAVAELVEKRRTALLERLAELEHEQWMAWAKTLMETEQISEQRKQRWQQYIVPYTELSEDVKEYDREWARKAVEIVNEWLHEVVKDTVQGD